MPAAPTAVTEKKATITKKAPKPDRDMAGASTLVATLLAPGNAAGQVSDEALINDLDNANGITTDHLAAVQGCSMCM
jgi:hypothetical protein